MEDKEKSNEFLVQLKGKAELGRPLVISKNYTIAAKFDITSEKKIDNHDGTYATVYAAEPTGELAIQNENGEAIMVKTKASVSKTLRAAIWTRWKDSNSELEFDVYYQRFGQAVLQELDYIQMKHMEELK